MELKELISKLEKTYLDMRTLSPEVNRFLPDNIYNIGYDYFEITIDNLKELI